MSKLLISEPPLMVLPKLATEIGLNEAIVLQQIHYWLDNYEKKKDEYHYHDGKWWVYNTLEEWHTNFPFWSTKTIQRALSRLRDMGLVITGNYNQYAYDKTLWYTIDYAAIDKLSQSNKTECPDRHGQNVQMDKDKMTTPIPEITTETTTETNTDASRVSPCGDIPLVGIKIVEPTNIKTEYSEVLLYQYATKIICPECGHEQEWPQSNKLRKRKENLTCSECGAYWKVTVNYDTGSDDVYKISLPQQEWIILLDDPIPNIGNRLTCSKSECLQFSANWKENPSMVVEKLIWAASQDWLVYQRTKIVARVNAAYETTTKSKLAQTQSQSDRIQVDIYG